MNTKDDRPLALLGPGGSYLREIRTEPWEAHWWDRWVVMALFVSGFVILAFAFVGVWTVVGWMGD